MEAMVKQSDDRKAVVASFFFGGKPLYLEAGGRGCDCFNSFTIARTAA